MWKLLIVRWDRKITARVHLICTEQGQTQRTQQVRSVGLIPQLIVQGVPNDFEILEIVPPVEIRTHENHVKAVGICIEPEENVEIILTPMTITRESE